MSASSPHIRLRIHESLFFVQRVPKKPLRGVKKLFHSRAVYDTEKKKLDNEALEIILDKQRAKSFQLSFQGQWHKSSLNRTSVKLKSSSSLVYNRVNKCGSSTMLKLLDNLGEKRYCSFLFQH